MEITGVSRNIRLGRWGEQAAAGFLLEHGFEVVDRNLRTPHGEIDLLARKEGLVIFVEVKSRASSSLGPPEISVNARKQAHLVACAEFYAQQHGIDHWRIDVIAVERRGGNIRITHFENAVS